MIDSFPTKVIKLLFLRAIPRKKEPNIIGYYKVRCNTCGVPFRKSISEVEKGRGLFCNRDCKKEHPLNRR